MSSSSSARAKEYRGLIEDVIAGGLLSDEERLELRDLLARVKRQVLAKIPERESVL